MAVNCHFLRELQDMVGHGSVTVRKEEMEMEKRWQEEMVKYAGQKAYWCNYKVLYYVPH